jgi:FkbM family methyltransferase
MCILDEIESGIYDYNYQGKVVLDIGGFEGDSAAFFWAMGAKKVIVYEPVLEHRKYIEENVRLNKINEEIHFEGIGNKNGVLTVAYHDADNCFGLQVKGLSNKRVIKIRDISEIIADSKADVAKIDCEGAEMSLVNVPKDTLRNLEYVMVETHTSEIRRALINKFKEAGFVLAKGKEETSDEISIAYFRRI